MVKRRVEKKWIFIALPIGMSLAWALMRLILPAPWGSTSFFGLQNAAVSYDFELPAADGKKRLLSRDFKGRALIVHFWASWCPPCIPEIKSFLEAAKKVNTKQAEPVFIAVAIDASWSDVYKVIPQDQWPKEVESFLDSDGQFAESWGSFQYPETYALSRTHQLLKKWVGAQEWDLVASALGIK